MRGLDRHQPLGRRLLVGAAMLLSVVACSNDDDAARMTPSPDTASPTTTFGGELDSTAPPASVIDDTEETWNFHLVAEGWNYDVTFTVSIRSEFDVDISSSPPGKAQLASWVQTYYSANAVGTDVGRSAPSLKFNAPFAYYSYDPISRIDHDGSSGSCGSARGRDGVYDVELPSAGFACLFVAGAGSLGTPLVAERLSYEASEQAVREAVDALRGAEPVYYMLRIGTGGWFCAAALIPDQPVVPLNSSCTVS